MWMTLAVILIREQKQICDRQGIYIFWVSKLLGTRPRRQIPLKLSNPPQTQPPPPHSDTGEVLGRSAIELCTKGTSTIFYVTLLCCSLRYQAASRHYHAGQCYSRGRSGDVSQHGRHRFRYVSPHSLLSIGRGLIYSFYSNCARI